MKRVLVLGCTGSIGRQTLDIIKMFPHRFELAGLSAHSKKDALLQIAAEFSCSRYALTGGGFSNEKLKQFIKSSKADIAVNGISGAAGLAPSVFVLEAGINLALANKETIVMAGNFIKALAKKNNAHLLPVDSEHSAVFNLMRLMRAHEALGENAVSQIILTASGGPFRELPKEQFASITAHDALQHPTWSMGKKITIDSATLANKGLEVIEACVLFDMPPEKVKVVVHPQSLVHSFVKTVDGVLYAQISKPDMRHPILNALTFPEVISNDLEEFDITSCSTGMTFCAPRFADFPMLDLAYSAVKTGQCIAYNAANEVCAEAFLAGKIAFTDFAPIVGQVMEQNEKTDSAIAQSANSAEIVDTIFEIDKNAREIAAFHITGVNK